jgi:hypothetical protein
MMSGQHDRRDRVVSTVIYLFDGRFLFEVREF